MMRIHQNHHITFIHLVNHSQQKKTFSKEKKRVQILKHITPGTKSVSRK